MSYLHEVGSGPSGAPVDSNVQIGDSSTASIKLDVMTSKQFNRLTVINIILVCYTFTELAVLSVSCNTNWYESHPGKNRTGESIDPATCKPPQAYMVILYVADIIACSALMFICIAFTVRVFRTSVRRSREQVWTLIILFTTAMSYNPFDSIVFFHDYILGKYEWQPNNPWLASLISVNRGIGVVVTSLGQLFYIWCNSHSFGILDDYDRPSKLRFYGPKLLLLSIHATAISVMAAFGISPSKYPFCSMIALVRDFRILKVWETRVFLPVMALTIIELAVIICIARRMLITANVLRKAQYVKNRGKQIGFRYFVMANIMAYGLFLCADACLLISVPRGFMPDPESDNYSHYRWFLYNGLFAPVPRLLNYTTTAMAAYVNLPADSVGFMGWFKGSGSFEDDKPPISFKVTSKKEDFDLKRMSTTIVLDLIVELFNFSDVAYLQKAKEAKSQRAIDYTQGHGFYLELEVFDEVTETYGTVFTNDHQIIVAFKGTTSVENMKTDMRVNTVGITKALPSKKDAKHEIMTSLDWKNAKLHKGFAGAYSSVGEELIQKIAELYLKKARPVYFTGHSLGASLCTIASLDVALSLNIRDIYVATYGSPRCGNLFWNRVYDQIVEAHWRIAMRSDIVTIMPRAGYTHVGKRVALTTTGEMFLDPNAIETVLWSSAGVNASDHGKEFIDREEEVPACIAKPVVPISRASDAAISPDEKYGTFNFGPSGKWTGPATR